MLRFGLLKYKKLNNSVSAAELDGLGRAGGDDNGNQSGTTTPVRQQQQQHPHQMIHNQLNGSLMKNTNSLAKDQSTRKPATNNTVPTLDAFSAAVVLERRGKKATQSPAKSTSPASSNYKLLAGPADQQRSPVSPGVPKKPSSSTMNCKARIYKCIKRILKRNNFASGKEQKVQQQQQVRDKSKVDYREIKSLLEKEKPALDYDVNLAKCVDKPALIKKIALNLLKSAEDDGRAALVAERLSETPSVQSDLEREAEYERLCGESWYHENLPRDMSLDLLAGKCPGTFVVRRSTTQQDCFALSLRVPPPGPKIAHYLIVRTATEGYQIKGFSKEFGSLRALIVHHSVMPEALPVPLAVPRPANLAVKSKCDDDYDTVFELAETALA
uniref:Tensin-3 n=2 Tax=Culex pipiens TaxID=7175 RepID=A0A8D8ERG0_CULPI